MRSAVLACCVSALVQAAPAHAQLENITSREAASALKAALEKGSTAAVARLGRTDGFFGNPQVKIALPGHLEDAAKVLRFTGQQRRVDELVTAMNRAAEAAVPEAKPLLVAAVKSLTVSDARAIVTGGDDSVTRFFADKTRAPLAERFLPIVKRHTESVDLAGRYNAVAGQAAQAGLLHGDAATVERYVTGKALDGLYFMIGEEEKKIRRDPIATGSAILSRAFAR